MRAIIKCSDTTCLNLPNQSQYLSQTPGRSSSRHQAAVHSQDTRLSGKLMTPPKSIALSLGRVIISIARSPPQSPETQHTQSAQSQHAHAATQPHSHGENASIKAPVNMGNEMDYWAARWRCGRRCRSSKETVYRGPILFPHDISPVFFCFFCFLFFPTYQLTTYQMQLTCKRISFWWGAAIATLRRLAGRLSRALYCSALDLSISRCALYCIALNFIALGWTDIQSILLGVDFMAGSG